MIRNSSSEDDSDDVEPKDLNSRFLWAAEKGRVGLLIEILEQNPSVISHRDEDGYSALHRASYEGHVDTVSFLLMNGADIHAKTNDGWTPLHSACKWNEIQVALLLLNNGADVNAQSNGLQTPLHLAASCKQSKDLLVMLLSRKEINHSLKNSVGETAQEIAQRTDKYSYLFDAVAPCVKEYC